MSLSFFNKLIGKQDISGFACHHLHGFFKTKIQSGDYEIVRKTPNNIHFCALCGEKIIGEKEACFFHPVSKENPVFLCTLCFVKIRLNI